MKSLANIANSYVSQERAPVMCDYVLGPWGDIKKEPFLSSEHKCEFCEGDKYNIFTLPNMKKQWLCANRECAVMKAAWMGIGTTTKATTHRALEWPLFCEIHGVGDMNHNVKFEEIRQSQGKIDYLKKFAEMPKGIIVMQGTKGTGKTYTSLATCELFTRKSTSAIFLTQKELVEKWLETFNSKELNTFLQKIREVSLLVVDDFGTAEMTPAFLSFFMDLINTRMQWTNRGTIITTNLDDDQMAKYCQEALNDRLLTGQYFVFEGPSQRKKTPL